MKFSSKNDLLERISQEHKVLVELVDSIPKREQTSAGVWGDDWTVKDLLAHLTEWEQMFLGWYRTGKRGQEPNLPAEGYKWNQTPALNQAIWAKHSKSSGAKVRRQFDASFEEIYSLAKKLTQKELLTPGHFPWTKKHPLTTYLGANTCSHYRVATKILKRWLKEAPAS